MQLINLIKDYKSQPVIGSMGWQFVLNASRMVFALISAVLLTRYFGPEDYGFYSFIIAIVSIFTLFSRAGADPISVKFFTQNPEDKNQIFGATILWRFLSWFLGLSLLITLVLISNDPRYGYALIIYAFLLFNPLDIIDHYFQSIYKNKYSLQARLITESFALLVKIYLVIEGYPLIYFIYAMAIQNLIYTAIIVYIYRYTQKEFPVLRFSKVHFFKIIRQSIPLFFASLMLMLYVRVDQVMLSYIAGNEELGFYAASSQITLAVFCLSVFFVQPMQVKFLQLGHDHKDYAKWLQYYFHIVTRTACLIALAGMLIAPFAIPLLFGTAFISSVAIFMIQIWVSVFSFQEVIRNREIINHYNVHYNLISGCVGLIVNLALNFVFIPLYGGIGAAIATLISQCAAAYMLSWGIKDLRAIARMQTKALLFRKMEIS